MVGVILTTILKIMVLLQVEATLVQLALDHGGDQQRQVLQHLQSLLDMTQLTMMELQVHLTAQLLTLLV